MPLDALCIRIKVTSLDRIRTSLTSILDLAELAGYTARVSELFETMEDVQKSRYQKALVSSAGVEENAKGDLFSLCQCLTDE